MRRFARKIPSHAFGKQSQTGKQPALGTLTEKWKNALFGSPSNVLRIAGVLGFLGIASYNSHHVTSTFDTEEVSIKSVNQKLGKYAAHFQLSSQTRKKESQTKPTSPASNVSSPCVFSLKFVGDLSASQVENLRREVTAIIENGDVSRGDAVVLTLRSSGGGVSEYGLAAAQLERLKTAGFHLTVCVDEVAASGGYMMACVADRIVAAPFAMLGSIGVLSVMPNFSERLKREGITVNEVSAGEYKTTMVPYAATSESKSRKSQEHVDIIHKAFKQFVKKHRPALEIDGIATGEVWLAEDAIIKGLCDALATSDDVILEHVHAGSNVLEVSIKPRTNSIDSFWKRLFKGGDMGLEMGFDRLLSKNRSTSPAGECMSPFPRTWLAYYD